MHAFCYKPKDRVFFNDDLGKFVRHNSQSFARDSEGLFYKYPELMLKHSLTDLQKFKTNAGNDFAVKFLQDYKGQFGSLNSNTSVLFCDIEDFI